MHLLSVGIIKSCFLYYIQPEEEYEKFQLCIGPFFLTDFSASALAVGVTEEWVTSTESGKAILQLWPFVMDLDCCCPVSISSLDSP